MRDFKKLAQLALTAVEEKKALRPLLLDLQENSSVADYLVIATAESSAQMGAIADEVERMLKADGAQLLHREGRPGHRWLVLDYGGLVVHILTPEAREFFRLEQLWEDAGVKSKPAKTKAEKSKKVKKPAKSSKAKSPGKKKIVRKSR